jgi:hypothetical protein
MLMMAFAAGVVVSCVPALGSDTHLATVAIGEVQLVQSSSDRASCSIARTNGTVDSYFPGFQATLAHGTYFDPTGYCGSPAYRFEITSFSFTLYDPGGYVWPVTVDVAVYSATDSCSGPGAELCRHTVVADRATYELPNIGTVVFPSPCPVDGPFFITLEYVTGESGSTPSICYDDQAPPDTCVNWFRFVYWYEWYDIWTPPYPGYPMFWVEVEDTCSVIIGDANNSGGGAPIDIDDVVYLIGYIFSGPPPPVPYAVASGDANCSCGVDIDDVVYLIAHIFSGGPPPCTCEEWVALCGSLH